MWAAYANLKTALAQQRAGVPMLPFLERTVTMLRSILALHPVEQGHDHALLSLLDEPQKSGLFADDAFTNPKHLSFALRGCLAASLCY